MGNEIVKIGSKIAKIGNSIVKISDVSFSPVSISNRIAWYDSTDLSTITKDAGNFV